MDLISILVSNAEVSLYEDDTCINFEANDGKGMMEFVLPEGLYEVQIKNLRLTISIFYSLIHSLMEQLQVTLSICIMALIGGLAANLLVSAFFIMRRK